MIPTLTELPSYTNIHALGKPELASLFSHPVVVQEKVDGSQISFGVIDGELMIRSKGKSQYPDTDKMFAKAVAEIEARKGFLAPGVVYRGEYLEKPKHNVLAYDRVPDAHIALFDIYKLGLYTGHESHSNVELEANRLGFGCVPMLHDWYTPADNGALQADVAVWLERESFLGGQKIEGVVFKNYQERNPHAPPSSGHFLAGKYVSEDFKEVHKEHWKTPGADFVRSLGEGLRTKARFWKAIQHLREQGALENSPRDIGPLMQEVSRDIEEEEGPAIRDALWSKYRKDILRGATKGFPEWYREELLTNQLVGAD